jgi:hypothetical protein
VRKSTIIAGLLGKNPKNLNAQFVTLCKKFTPFIIPGIILFGVCGPHSLHAGPAGVTEAAPGVVR